MKLQKSILDMMVLIIGCISCSIAVNWVAIPNGFVATGLTGLAMAISTLTNVHFALIQYLLLGSVLLGTYIIMGTKEVRGIILLTILYPAVLWAMNYIPCQIIFKEKLIAVAVYGFLLGVGTGLCYRRGFSYGGTDTIAKIFKHAIMRNIPLKGIIIGIDFVILTFMLSIYNLDVVAYAFVGQLIYAVSMNYIIFVGGQKLYQIQIICDETKEFEDYIINNIKKTATIHDVVGAYSKCNKKQIDFICTSREYIKFKEFIRMQNRDCFIRMFQLMYVYGRNHDFMNIGNDL